MSAPQLDLFAAAPALPPRAMAVTPQQARPAAQEPFPTPPTLPWAKRLTEAGRTGQDVTFLVSLLATGVCVEALCQGAAGRTLLYADGSINEIIPDPGAFGRIIYLNPDQAAAIHAKRPLIQIDAGGTHSARYRLARQGEAAPVVLPLPEGGPTGGQTASRNGQTRPGNTGKPEGRP